MNAKEKQLETEVVVVGAGPAGLGLTYELLSRGIETVCVAPELLPWAPRYGAWADDLHGLQIPLKNQWSNALVSFPRHEPVVLDHAYVQIDSAALFRNWSESVHRLGAFTGGSVTSTLFSGENFEIQLDSGASISARQVFDASGHRAKIVERAPMGPAFQTAFGAISAPIHDTLGDDTMGLLLWDDGLQISDSNMRTPAFYYVMTESAEIAFSEYTVLSARPMVPVEALEKRVRKDLSSFNLQEDEFERCIIPMGYPVPRLDQAVVGFGGAASMVHPATGYMMSRVLRTLPELADGYVATRHLDTDDRARACWDIVWPTKRIRTHELFRFGLEALLTMDVEQTHAFFAAFFSLPDELWRPYQSGTATPGQVAAAMWEVFKRVDAPLKRRLAATGLGPHLAKLGRLIF